MRLWLTLLLTLSACAADRPAIEVRDAYGYESVLGKAGAVYFTVENRSDLPDTLVSIEVTGALVAMIHDQVTTGEMVEMRHVGALPVAPRSTVVLAPGGLHLMLDGVEHAPVAGDTLQVTARFSHAGTVTFAAPVLPYGTER